MGQQQLLLLVLATVIVGLATVAGIQAFEQGQTRANQDALTSTAVKIASDIQARVKEPSQFGGYDGDLNDSGTITLEELGYSTIGSSSSDYFSSKAYEAADGECAITSASLDGDVNVTCESDQNKVVVKVSSLKSGGITTTTTTVKS